MKRYLQKIIRALREKKGFTLVEMLATLTAFAIILLTVGAIFVQVTALQRRGFGAQKIQENAQFALETMAREIRVSTIQSGNATCAGADFTSTLTIDHPIFGIVQYALDPANGLIRRTESGVDTYITSRDVAFTKLYFCIQGAGIDKQQARVAILATAENTNATTKDTLSVPIETTVSTREITTELTN